MRMGVMLRLAMAPTIPHMGESWVDALLLACLVSFAPRAGLPQGELRTPVGACWLFSPRGRGSHRGVEISCGGYWHPLRGASGTLPPQDLMSASLGHLAISCHGRRFQSAPGGL